MHIILVSDRMATAKTITLTRRHVVTAVAALVGLVLLVSTLASFVTLKHIERIPLPYAQSLLLSLRQQEAQKTQDVVRDNLNAMAVKLGEMQARIVRLDTLGERLARLTGIKPEAPQDEPPAAGAGKGGPLVMLPARLDENDLQRQLEILALQLESRDDHFGLLETRLLDERVRRSLLPTALPIAGAESASGFGWRRDPFNGQRALHEGVDFSVDSGTPVLAAAGGVVVSAEYHPAYGNLIEIDHGNELTTRYAHASRMLVKEGAVVRRGQKIAEVGSTGRSTGPHLHFEVRVKGMARDPRRFLEAARSGDRLLAAAIE
jgi:murein DD-endopeptidase MepM/ murein hydrolase activator NlpD